MIHLANFQLFGDSRVIVRISIYPLLSINHVDGVLANFFVCAVSKSSTLIMSNLAAAHLWHKPSSRAAWMHRFVIISDSTIRIYGTRNDHDQHNDAMVYALCLYIAPIPEHDQTTTNNTMHH